MIYKKFRKMWFIKRQKIQFIFSLDIFTFFPKQSKIFCPTLQRRITTPKINCKAKPHITCRQRILPGCLENTAPNMIITIKPSIDNNLLRSSEESTIKNIMNAAIKMPLMIAEANLIFMKSSQTKRVGRKTLWMAFSPVSVDVKNQLNTFLQKIE